MKVFIKVGENRFHPMGNIFQAEINDFMQLYRLEKSFKSDTLNSNYEKRFYCKYKEKLTDNWESLNEFYKSFWHRESSISKTLICKEKEYRNEEFNSEAVLLNSYLTENITKNGDTLL